MASSVTIWRFKCICCSFLFWSTVPTSEYVTTQHIYIYFCVFQANQIQQMFPHMPFNTIVDDLISTRSMDVTVENILDGKLVAPTVCVFT